MGKAQVKFTILVPAHEVLNPLVEKLREKGHVIVPAPAAEIFLDSTTLTKEVYIEAALKGARARKKGKTDEAVS